jgi:hypothetical protein
MPTVWFPIAPEERVPQKPEPRLGEDGEVTDDSDQPDEKVIYLWVKLLTLFGLIYLTIVVS